MGRARLSHSHVQASNQTTAGQASPFVFSYSWNRAGALNSETYPSGRTVTIGYDGANRPHSVTSDTKTYISAVNYAPHGGMTAYSLGNGISGTRGFNSRLQPVSFAETMAGANRLTLGFDYGTSGNNGNLLTETISTSDLSQPLTQTYTYDGANRLRQATETAGGTTWSRTFAYDAYGNQCVSAASGVGLHPFTPQADPNTGSCTNFNSSNQLLVQGSTYDAVGNQLGIGSGSFAFTYDAENRQTNSTQTIQGVATTTAYGYDGEGRRVQKAILGAATTTYVYDALGQLIAEYGSTGAAATCTPCYVSVDHLGSTRMLTNASGTVVERHDFLPFGEEIPNGIAGRGAQWGIAEVSANLHQKFSGKERDSETNLDYFGARYFSGAQGRFTSPDPVFASPQKVADPQQWNMYAYVRNNPLAFTDPTGLDFNLTGCGKDSTTCRDNKFQTTVLDSSGNATVTAIVLRQSDDGTGVVDQNGISYNATFDQSGFNFSSSADGSVSGGGQFINGSNETDLNGSGIFSGTQGRFISDCGGSCQGKGSLYDIAPGATQAAKDAIGISGADVFNIFGGHGKAENYRTSGDQDAHLVQHLDGPNRGKAELHFEGHPPGRDLVNFILHQVDAIRDSVNHQSSKEPRLP